MKKKNRVFRIATIISLVALVIIAGLLFFNFVIHRGGPSPGKVEGLTADVCYNDITLSWEPAEKAVGYYIYAAESDKEFTRIAEVSGHDICTYEYREYTHDIPYRLKVAAYSRNNISRQITEGEVSDAVSAEYDSSKYAQKVPVLAYHGLTKSGYEIPNSLSITEDNFEEQMQYLKDNGYKTLTMDEFYRWHKGELEVPVKSCLLTFDDGSTSVYYLAYPKMKKLGIAATVFCIGHWLGDNNGVTKPYVEESDEPQRFAVDKLEEIRADYPRIDLESHTYNMHKRINGKEPVYVLTYEEMMEDFKKNEIYGFKYLSYPWGYTNDNFKRALKDSNYRLAFCYGPFRYARRTDPDYEISRIKLNGRRGIDSFIEIVSGDYEEEELVVMHR